MSDIDLPPGARLWRPELSLPTGYNVQHFESVIPRVHNIAFSYDPANGRIAVLDSAGHEYSRVEKQAAHIGKLLARDKPPAAFAAEVLHEYDPTEEALAEGVHLSAIHTTLINIDRLGQSNGYFGQSRNDLLTLLWSLPRPTYFFNDLTRFPGAPRGTNILRLYSRAAARYRYSGDHDSEHMNEVREAVANAGLRLPSYARLNGDAQPSSRGRHQLARPIPPVATAPANAGVEEPVEPTDSYTVPVASMVERNGGILASSGPEQDKLPAPPRTKFDASIKLFDDICGSVDDIDKALEILVTPKSLLKVGEVVRLQGREKMIDWAHSAIVGYFEESSTNQFTQAAVTIEDALRSRGHGVLADVIDVANRYSRPIHRAGGFPRQNSSFSSRIDLPVSDYEQFVPEAFARLHYISKIAERRAKCEANPRLDAYAKVLYVALRAAFPAKARR